MTRRNFLIVEDGHDLPFALTAHIMERYSPERLQQLIFESLPHLQDYLYTGGLAQICDSEVNIHLRPIIQKCFDGNKLEEDGLRVIVVSSYSEAITAINNEIFDGAILDMGIEAGDNTFLDVENLSLGVDNQNLQRYHRTISRYDFPIGFVRFPELPDKGLARTLEELQAQKERSEDGPYGILVAKRLSDKGVPVVMNTADIPHGSAGIYLGVGLGLFDGKRVAEDIGRFSSDSYHRAYEEFSRNRLIAGELLWYPSSVPFEIVEKWHNRNNDPTKYWISADSIHRDIDRVNRRLELERNFNRSYKVLCGDGKVPLVVGAKEGSSTYETTKLPVTLLLERVE